MTKFTPKVVKAEEKVTAFYGNLSHYGHVVNPAREEEERDEDEMMREVDEAEAKVEAKAEAEAEAEERSEEGDEGIIYPFDEDYYPTRDYSCDVHL